MIIQKCHTSEEINQELLHIHNNYEDFTTFRTLGNSHDNRPVSLLRIGLGIETIVMTAGLYGKEDLNPLLLLKLAESYAKAYAENLELNKYPVRKLLNQCSVTILPLLNPDGYEIAHNGFQIIRNPILRQMCKMRGIESENWKYNARGVDLNGNFPCQTYEPAQLGEYPSSEQETRLLMRVFEEYDTSGYLNFYSNEKIVCYYRPEHRIAPFSFRCQMKRFPYRLRNKNNNMWKPGEHGESGSPAAYYTQLIGNPAFCIETVDNYRQNPWTLEQTSLEIQHIPLEIIKKM